MPRYSCCITNKPTGLNPTFLYWVGSLDGLCFQDLWEGPFTCTAKVESLGDMRGLIIGSQRITAKYSKINIFMQAGSFIGNITLIAGSRIGNASWFWSHMLWPRLEYPSQAFLGQQAVFVHDCLRSWLERNMLVEGFDWEILKQRFMPTWMLFGWKKIMHKWMYVNGMYKCWHIDIIISSNPNNTKIFDVPHVRDRKSVV